ncbi:MAG: hypothetical protein KF716_01995 [Anaerolineae bacterium]|nr:hypothetical protein [Anaerolineae bacterium]
MRSQNSNLLGYIVIGGLMLAVLINIFDALLPSAFAFLVAAGITWSFINNMSRNQQRRAQNQSQSGDALDYLPYHSPSSRENSSAQQVADKALQKANNSPHSRGIRLLDIGMLAYDGGKQPKVTRTETVPASATHLRPYMVINFPYTRNAFGRITFELLDDDDQVRFVADQRYEVTPGQNFLTPQNWLPMGDEEPGGNWKLRISIGDQLLALHDFKITPDAGAAFRTYLRPDGEIDEWLAKSAAQSATESMSLDELIGDQEEIDIDMFRESQAQRQIRERR